MCKSPNSNAWFAWFMGSDMGDFRPEDRPSAKDKLRLTMLAALPVIVLSAVIGLPVLLAVML